MGKLFVDVECETAADFRAFRQTIAIAPYIAVRTMGGMFEVRHMPKFKQLLEVCAGRILEEREQVTS